MSTTTSSPGTSEAEDVITSTASQSVHGWLLIFVVFIAGACSLAVELTASRLLAPYFGTDLFVWANLIGLILLYLTIGYYLGGRLADRYPRPMVLYLLTTVAAFLISLIPVLSKPILTWSQGAFVTYSISEFYGSLLGVILLFAIPMILLGCVSPFAIRLRVQQVGKAGRTSGQLYAISTAGSILGTFLPVLVLIPNIGTYLTFFSIALTLLLASIAGLIVTRLGNGKDNGKSDGNSDAIGGASNRAPTAPRSSASPVSSMKAKKRPDSSLLSILLLIPMGLTLLGTHGPIKAGYGGGRLIVERESAYNYIQVVQIGSETQLILNEGLGVHSIYNPNVILTQGPWDYFMVAPYFNNPPFTQKQVQRVCIIGLGAGTIPRQFSAAYGSIPIDGVEIDGAIVDLARHYFNMNEPNLHVIVQDGRYYLQTTAQTYDVIGIDAYQQPYVPFQLTTVEFFREVRAHLSPTGVAVINAGRTQTDFRLVEALAQTMRAAFPTVYIIDSQRFTNSLVIGTNAPTAISNFQINTANLTSPLLSSVAQASITYGHMREEQTSNAYFTDDRAPVEQLIDQIIFSTIQNNGK